jgi:hypothetical protein
MASSIGSQDSVSFLLTIQATGFLTVALVGLPPTEYASLRWTHQHAGLSRRTPGRMSKIDPLFNRLRHIFAPVHRARAALSLPAAAKFSDGFSE